MSQDAIEAVIAAPAAAPPFTVLTAVQMPQVMTSVCAMISASCLGKDGCCFIGNPWQDLLDLVPAPQRKTKAQWQAPATVTLDTCPHLPKTQDRIGYIRDGRAKLRNKTFSGVCNDYAWAVASMLVATKYPGAFTTTVALLPLGVRVEVYGIVGNPEAKHMFVVVGRDLASTAGDPQTWGPSCFVVDQWYALQTATAPVKTLAQGSTHYDPAFAAWWASTVPGTKVGSGNLKKPLPNWFAQQMEFRVGEFLPEF